MLMMDGPRRSGEGRDVLPDARPQDVILLLDTSHSVRGATREQQAAFAEAYGVKHAIAANSAMSLLISAVYAAGAGAPPPKAATNGTFRANPGMTKDCEPTT